MNIKNTRAVISTQKISRSFTYDNKVMLTVDIEYPSILLAMGGFVQTRINLHYKNTAMQFFRYAVRTLYPNAVTQYKNAVANGFPFFPYEAVMKYTVTMNEDCTLSTYTDQYEFTGGAHGNTVRTSDNWNLQTGRRLQMGDLFDRGANWKPAVIREITRQAEKNMAENPGIYFDDYKKLIAQTFNPQSFNLTPKYLQVYYQQYDIAPYSSGVIVFSLPYDKVGAKKPQCSRFL